MRTTGPTESNRTRVLNSDSEHAFRLASVVEAIADAEKMLILCGDGVYSSVDGLSGLEEPVRMENGLFTGQTTLRRAIQECSPSTLNSNLLPDSQLAAFNQVMARRRTGMANAKPGPFYEWLGRSFCQNKRLAGNPRSRLLRPSIDARMDHRLLPGGEWRDQILHVARGCELLLVVGINLKHTEIYQLIYEISGIIHHRHGAVIYVDPRPIRGRNTHQVFDIHLQVDIGHVFTQLLSAIHDPPGSEEETGSNPGESAEDRWFQVFNHYVHPTAALEEPEYTKPVCCLCNMGVEECLLKCKLCGNNFCYPGQYNADQRSRACVVLGGYASTRSIQLETAVDEFICPWCWRHAEQGIYPHYVIPTPRLTVQIRDQPAPRMAMLVYYLDSFWPQAKHLCSLVASRWSAQGWPCMIEPRKLEDLGENRIALEHCAWEASTFNLFVVYITHGLSETRGYQVSHNDSKAPVELFNLTLAPAKSLIARARDTTGFLISCGDPLLQSRQTREIQEWINLRDDSFDTLLGCLNLKLAPAFMVNFVARATTMTARKGQLQRFDFLNCWLSDGVACPHTDLLYMAPFQLPSMWLFSPFDSRPLGKELPHLLTVCACRPDSRQAADQTVRSARKVWIVDHHAKPDMQLRDVTVKARCSLCKKQWVLENGELDGVLYKSCGLWAAIVPYFSAEY
ncbi:hypothetical protein FRC09_010665 [Ceratobasidium sp. 395]|nr:hypothetical protein FRC09_010665 [Ceratobasidium sp. 395]